jgi:hypothetical protein
LDKILTPKTLHSILKVRLDQAGIPQSQASFLLDLLERCDRPNWYQDLPVISRLLFVNYYSALAEVLGVFYIFLITGHFEAPVR